MNETASDDVTRLPEAPDSQTKLKLYGLFKQASQGDVTGDRPGIFDFVGGAKFDAWKALAGTSKDDASQKYIDLVESLKAKS